jgi:class 3 adenylate cyclase/tetratricopeptide (TPR) repeat protein
MIHCSSCGVGAPASARFCSNCGAALTASVTPTTLARAPVEERRFVSILFVDLVGFTERSDAADPEDVRTVLIPYHARVKEILEHFGGTLDKFIGDAVMGVFGAPTAHEDDPERAVRAGLRILDAIEDLKALDPLIQVRVAINSGEAVVAQGAGPQVGEAVAGDVVNTASRMQSLAPPGGLVIGEATERLVRHAFETEARAPATVKGKAQPLLTWRVIGERGAGEGPASAGPGFVGRAAELDQLTRLWGQVSAERRLRVVTILGEPGIGKSRLVEEFRRRREPGGAWLLSSCAPYGETSALEPLARLIREIAGIQPAAPPVVALHGLLAFVDGAEGGGRPSPFGAHWLRSRLCAILGLEGDQQEEIGGGELADALGWALTAHANGRPLAICIHDLHWAHDSLLNVLAEAARALDSEAVLMITTARTEFERRDAHWPPDGVAKTRIAVRPLRPPETEELVRTLLADGADPDVTERLTRRSAGNPLYAVEFARMLADPEAPEEARVEMPGTVRAVVGARLDALPTNLRDVVQRASVAGAEFWPDLLGELSGTDAERAAGAVDELLRRDLVRATQSTISGHAAFGFAHDVVREVAYERIPRAPRGRAHLRVATWLERHAGERADTFAESIAGHLFQAVSFGRAAGDVSLAEEAAPGAVRWTLAAAARAMRTDAAGALSLFERAADLAPDGSATRVDALLGAGMAGRRSGRLAARETLERYQEALAVARVVDDKPAQGRALVRVGSQLGAMGEIARSREALNEAVGLLESGEPGRDLAAAYAYRAEDAMFSGRTSGALADAGRALTTLEAVEGADDLIVMALHIRGDGRCAGGDRGGLEDLDRALELSLREENTADIITSHNYVADWRWAYEGPAAALPHYEEGVALADLRGSVSQGLWSKAGLLPQLLELGEWERVMVLADEILSVGSTHMDAAIAVTVQSHRARALVESGRSGEAPPAAELMAAAEGLSDDVQAASHGLLASAALAAVAGDTPLLTHAMERFEAVTNGAPPEYREAVLAPAVRICVSGRANAIAERLIAASRSEIPHHRCMRLTAEAVLAEAMGHRNDAARAYQAAADAWAIFGVAREERLARDGLERCS